MKLRMDSKLLKRLAMAATLSCACLTTIANVNGFVSAQESGNASGQYKIAVVDRKALFDTYAKKQTLWSALEADKTKAEADLNQRLDALSARRKAYETDKDKMTEEQRATTESTLNRDIQLLEADGRTKQAELSRRGENIIKTVTSEINEAIKAIGEKENYHLIFEADSAISSVVYFAGPLNITSQVDAYLKANGGAAAAAPAAAAPAAPAASGNRPRR